MIIRPQYLNTLKTYRDDLQSTGVAADHIISMRYTSEDFDDGMTDKDIYRSIKEQMTDDGRLSVAGRSAGN